MKRLVFGIIIFIIVGTVSGCGKDKKSSDELMVTKNQDSTLIYLTQIDVTKPDELLDIGCKSEVVGIKINKKLSPRKALIELFSYKKYNKDDGLYNVFSTSDKLKIENILIQNNFAIVTLSENLNLNGLCDGMRAYAQISQTLTQFDDIAGVDVFVGDEELTSYLSARNKYNTNP